MRGVLTVEAADEQEARANAFAKRLEEGIEWKYVEEDEEYDPRIVEVDPL
jgi:hypothetical protein